MLPQTVTAELFNVEYREIDMSIEFICSKLVEFGFIVTDQKHFDPMVWIKFKRQEDHGELRIDRMNRSFYICAVVDGETIFPIEGGWEAVLGYLHAAVQSQADSQI